MKWGGRFRRGFSRIAALVSMILVAGIVLNLGLLGFIMVQTMKYGTTGVKEYADRLAEKEGRYSLPKVQEEELLANGQWAILIDKDGHVAWDYNKPKEVHTQYSLTEIARISRWYLQDYPVEVWSKGENLFVLGSPKRSVWKYAVQIPMKKMEVLIIWLPVVLLCNFLIILGIAYLFIRKWYGKRDQARVAWITSVSHDVRTPLSVVMGYAGSLEQDIELGEEKRQQAHFIRKKSEEMRDLISDLNLTNRLEYAMEPLKLEVFPVAATVRDVAAEFLNDLMDDRHGLEVEISKGSENSMLKGDRKLIQRLLKNLIGNSMKHNPDGGNVSIGLETKWWFQVITVKDDGKGYSLEQQRTLNSKKTQIVSGHGMGLEIVKQIAASHGGKAKFSNSESGGACCLIYLKKFRGKTD